jgi:hypothetical protein
MEITTDLEGAYRLPDETDLRCPECGGSVSYVTPIVSDPEESYAVCVVNPGPRMLGWNTIPCLHFVEAKEHELIFSVGQSDIPYVRFEPRQVVE